MALSKEDRIDAFVENAAFAKEVDAPGGPAVMIGGEIFEIRGPFNGNLDNYVSPAELFTRAFRRLAHGESSVTASAGSQ